MAFTLNWPCSFFTPVDTHTCHRFDVSLSHPDKFLFPGPGIHKDHIYVAVNPIANGSPGSLGKYLDADAGFFCHQAPY